MPESSKPAEPVQKKPHEKTLENDKRFGKALQNKGYITPYQFERVSARQQRYVKSGKLVRLSTILLKREMISYEHAEEAFELIGEPRRLQDKRGTREYTAPMERHDSTAEAAPTQSEPARPERASL